MNQLLQFDAGGKVIEGNLVITIAFHKGLIYLFLKFHAILLDYRIDVVLSLFRRKSLLSSKQVIQSFLKL
jgi:hypothetical protein